MEIDFIRRAFIQGCVFRDGYATYYMKNNILYMQLTKPVNFEKICQKLSEKYDTIPPLEKQWDKSLRNIKAIEKAAK